MGRGMLLQQPPPPRGRGGGIIPPPQQPPQQAQLPVPLPARYNRQTHGGYTDEEKTDMLTVFIQSHQNSVLAAEQYRRLYPHRAQPFRTYFRKLEAHLKRFGSFKKPRQPRRLTATDEDNAINVLAQIEVYPRTSLRQIERLGISLKTSAQRILKKYRYHPYKPKRVQRLHNEDNQRRLTYARRMLDEHIDLSHVIWSDECTFSNQGAPNRQNYRCWALTNPHGIVETNDQYKYSVNVWCGLVNNHLLGPYIFDENMTGGLYLHFLRYRLPELIRNLPPHINRDRLIFHQDGHPAHGTRLVKQRLGRMFGDRVILVDRHADAEETPFPLWPARSPDETPLDFYLWGYLKDKIYVNMPPNAEAMKQRIREECAGIPAEQILRACTDGVKERLRLTVEKGGGHIEPFLKHVRRNL